MLFAGLILQLKGIFVYIVLFYGGSGTFCEQI